MDDEDEMDVDAGQTNSSNYTSTLPFKPQKDIVYNRLLPYNQQLDTEALDYLEQIKSNISRAVLLSDPRALYWIWDLSKYIRIYGRLFSKADHLYFVQLLLDVVLTPELELTKVSTYASVLTTLLKKRDLLSRDDLSIEWRPLYELYEKTLYSSKEHHHLILVPDGFETSLKSLIRGCRAYFPIRSTQKILDEFRPLLCPFDPSMTKGTLYLELFLPTVCRPDEFEFGYKLWLDELMNIWEQNLNSPSWEQNLIWIFSRLSHNCIGYIDWRPYIPKIFTHLLKSFNLQGGSHKVNINRNYSVFDVNSVVHWIISMLGGSDDLAIHHLEMLFKSLESYYHPSNIGKWNAKLSQLLYKLPSEFVRRLHRERYKKETWETPIPKSYHLSETTITRFVQALKPIISVSMFSRYGSVDSAFALQHLSVIRPEIVIPPLLEILYSSLETVTEPHRLIATLQCAVAVGRSMVRGGDPYPDGPTHVIPLLLASLPGIDSNDVRKSVVTFQFISTFVTLIPIVDCTAAVEERDDLTQIEYNLCLLTGQFESFVLQFMDRCFAMVENSVYEHRPERQDTEGIRLNVEEGITEVGLTSTLSSILTQCSPSILESVLDKLYTFVSNRIFETKVAGKYAANMVRACVKANPELACAKFLPHFCRLAMTLTESEDIIKEETLDDELLFCLLLLSEAVRCDGKVLLKYRDIIKQVLGRTISLESRKGYTLASTMLQNLLKALTSTYATDFRSTNVPWTEYEDFTKHFPIRDWGRPGDIKDLKVAFHVPDEAEQTYAKELLELFMFKELDYLSSWTKNGTYASREAVRRSLTIIVDCISGAAASLPAWPGDNVQLVETRVPLNTWRVKEVGMVRPIDLNGQNVRKLIADQIRAILVHVLKTAEDDTKSLNLIVRIYYMVLFYYGISRPEFDARWKSFQRVKRALENKLVGSKLHIRALLIDRVVLQHELRVANANIFKFTSLHKDILEDLLELSLSHYSEVRKKAQETLNICFRFSSYAYRLVLPRVLSLIAKNSESTHEEFKGALYVLLGKKGKSILTVADWETLSTVWMALVDSKHSEKPSIIRLFGQINDSIHKYFETVWIRHELPCYVKDQAKLGWKEVDGAVIPKTDCPSDLEIEHAQLACNKTNEHNVVLYNGLVNGLVKLIEDGELHWRYMNLAFGLLATLVRYDIMFPVEGVRTMVKNLNHETLLIRKVCISWVAAILKQQKRTHAKRPYQVPTDKSNTWLQFERNVDYLDRQVWNSTAFIFKPHVGFYGWPKVFEITDFENEPRVDRTREDLTDFEKPLFDFFNNQENVDKMLEFFSLEDRKGHDKFSTSRFQLFKGLFTSYGTTFLPRFETTLSKFVNDSTESPQRCASEFIAGLLRGSRHWPHDEQIKLRAFCEPLIKDMLVKILPETVYDWGTCCATCFEREDGRRLSWFVDLVTEDPLSVGLTKALEAGQNGYKVENRATSFLQSSRIYCVLGVIQQQEWRGLNLLSYLLDYLVTDDRLTNSYQNVRERIGVLLTNIFVYDVELPSLDGTLDLAPKRETFVRFLISKLGPFTAVRDEDAMDTTDKDEKGDSVISPERKAAANLLKVISKWIVQNFSKSSCSASASLFDLLPILCQAQSENNDEELIAETLFAVVVMSHTILNKNGIECAFRTCKQVMTSKSWHARSAIATFLQYMVSTNLFTIMVNDEWVAEIKSMILSLLEDERIEVRESGANTLGGLIHCEFIKVDKQLLHWFKAKAKTVLKKVQNPNNENKMSVDPLDLISRHAGMLGLCAVVNAFPYDVPEFMPRVLMVLADHLHDPPPIPATIKKTLSSFKRTHHDNWRDHKLKFSDDQLVELTNLLVSPSYYA